MATQGVSKSGVFFSLTSRFLAVSFVAGLGLAACSGDADMTDEIVQPSYGVDAPEGAPLDVTTPSNSAESTSGEKPVAATEDAAAAAVASDLGMSAQPAAPAVSEKWLPHRQQKPSPKALIPSGPSSPMLARTPPLLPQRLTLIPLARCLIKIPSLA